MRRFPLTTVLAALGLVLILLLYTVTFQVRFNQVAVRARLQEVNEKSKIEEPGLYWKLPWPLETVKVFDRRIQTLDLPEAETKTRDGMQLIIGTFALWKIEDPLKFYVRAESERQAKEKLRSRLNQERAAVIGKYDLSDLVNLDAEQVRYDQIMDEMLKAAAPGIEADYGIKLVSLGVRRVSLPESVVQKVFESMVRERENLATKYRAGGASSATAIRARAESAANQIKSFAQTKAQEIQSAGIEASARILAQVKQEDREFFIWLRWLDALRASLREKSTIFFDANSEIAKMFAAPPGGQMPAVVVPTPSESQDKE